MMITPIATLSSGHFFNVKNGTMKDCNYISIAGWMGNRLGLRGNDLICFAVIYGFSQDGESKFRGNLTYLTECMFCSRPTALLALDKLVALEYITKETVVVDGKKRCYYAAAVGYEDGEIISLDGTGQEPLPKTGKEPLPVTSKEPLPKKTNNIDNIDDRDKEKKILSKDKKEKKDAAFEAFWAKYRKGSKQSAYRSWLKMTDKECETALSTVDIYLTYCKRSNRPLKDVSTYLNQKCYNDDWDAVPEYYQQQDYDTERFKHFKRYMIERHRNLIYHRRPLTFEQLSALFEAHTVEAVERAMDILSQRDIHQYYSLDKEIERIIKDESQEDEV